MSSLTQRLQGLPLRAKDPPPKTINFGEWLPDLPAYGNPGCITALNVVPAGMSYRPLPDFTVHSDALVGRARGGISAKKSDGTTYFYAGDETALYEIRNQTATDKKSGTYTSAAASYWEFVEFDSFVIGTNYDDAVQSITTGAAGNFAGHFTSTLKPRMRHIAVVRDFLVGGYIFDGSNLVPNQVRWSALGDSVDWDVDATTQSDFQNLRVGGAVTKVVSGAEYGLVFQEKEIKRMTYVGSPLIFDFDSIDRQRGTPIPGSVIGLGRFVFFITEEGVHYTDGTQSTAIGHDKVDKWFWDQFDPNYTDRVSAAIDRVSKCIVWTFPGEGASDGEPNRILIYAYANKRFSYGDLEAQILVGASTQNYSVDDLDNLFGSIDDVTPGLDAPDWKGGVFRFAAFNRDNKLVYFTGQNLAATLDTGEGQLVPGRMTIIEDVRPLVDGGAATVAIGSRNLQNEAVAFTADASQSSEGLTSQRKKARYHRFRVKQPAGEVWTHAQGVEVEAHRPMGRRG